MLSVVILTKNEEKNISSLITNLCQAEIIIINDHSTDKTKHIIAQASHTGCVRIKYFTRSLHDDFAAQRNFGLSQAAGDWVFFVDADEVVSKVLMQEINQLVTKPVNQTAGYYVYRQDVLWGKTMTGTDAGRSKVLRLIKKGKGKWVRRVHEYLACRGETETLKNSLGHNPHSTLKEFITDINYYSTLHAQENFYEHKKSSMPKIILYPFFKFLHNWIILGGYKDGTRGCIVSLVMSLHSFLAWSKLWLTH